MCFDLRMQFNISIQKWYWLEVSQRSRLFTGFGNVTIYAYNISEGREAEDIAAAHTEERLV